MRQLNPGELSYNGRRVNPATFNISRPQGKDLRRLIGQCQRCGVTLRGRAAVPAPDPFDSEINDDDTPVVQCATCHQLSVSEL